MAHRLMTKEEKKDMRIYLEALADRGQVKREGIDAFLKNDLTIPQCSICKCDIKDWMGDDKAIQIAPDDYECTACNVNKTRKYFRQADESYAETLPPEEKKRIEETLAEDKELSTEAGQKAKEVVKETVPQTPDIVNVLQGIATELKESREINKELLSLLKPKTLNEPKFTRKEIK